LQHTQGVLPFFFWHLIAGGVELRTGVRTGKASSINVSWRVILHESTRSNIQHTLWAIERAGVSGKEARGCCTKVGGINPSGEGVEIENPLSTLASFVRHILHAWCKLPWGLVRRTRCLCH